MKVGRSAKPVVEHVCVDVGLLKDRFPVLLKCVGDGSGCGSEFVVVGENCADRVGSPWYKAC